MKRRKCFSSFWISVCDCSSTMQMSQPDTRKTNLYLKVAFGDTIKGKLRFLSLSLSLSLLHDSKFPERKNRKESFGIPFQLRVLSFFSSTSHSSFFNSETRWNLHEKCDRTERGEGERKREKREKRERERCPMMTGAIPNILSLFSLIPSLSYFSFWYRFFWKGNRKLHLETKSWTFFFQDSKAKESLSLPLFSLFLSFFLRDSCHLPFLYSLFPKIERKKLWSHLVQKKIKLLRGYNKHKI